MKKVVLKVDLHDEKTKKRIMKKVSGMQGIDTISVDMKEKKLTVIGDVDPVCVVSQLRKFCELEIISVGPAKESDDKKKDVKADEPKKAEEKKKEVKNDVSELVKAYEAYNPEFKSYYYVKSVDENPNACTIA